MSDHTVPKPTTTEQVTDLTPGMRVVDSADGTLTVAEVERDTHSVTVRYADIPDPYRYRANATVDVLAGDEPLCYCANNSESCPNCNSHEDEPDPNDDDTSAVQAAAIGAPLAAHLSANGYDYATYQVNDSALEHNWRKNHGEHEISLLEGRLVYDLQGVTLLTALVASPQQITILLSAFGVAPVEMTTAYELAAAADIDATLGARTYERDMGEPAPGPLPAGVDGHSISRRDGGTR